MYSMRALKLSVKRVPFFLRWRRVKCETFENETVQKVVGLFVMGLRGLVRRSIINFRNQPLQIDAADSAYEWMTILGVFSCRLHTQHSPNGSQPCDAFLSPSDSRCFCIGWQWLKQNRLRLSTPLQSVIQRRHHAGFKKWRGWDDVEGDMDRGLPLLLWGSGAKTPGKLLQFWSQNPAFGAICD